MRSFVSGRLWKPWAPAQVMFWMASSVPVDCMMRSRRPCPMMTFPVLSTTPGITGRLPGPGSCERSRSSTKTGSLLQKRHSASAGALMAALTSARSKYTGPSVGWYPVPSLKATGSKGKGHVRRVLQ
ncbi:hypothetical protein CH063_02928, partial [Colletotrichum higginsianum]